MKLLVKLGIVVLVAGCSTPATPSPGSDSPQSPAQATQDPGGQATPDTGGGQATTGTQPNQGDNKAKAKALVPPGASQLSEVAAGSNYTVQVTSTKSLDELGSFWTQAISSAGLTETGRFTAEGTLTIAFTNPDGGIVASQDPSSGTVIITISVGTS